MKPRQRESPDAQFWMNADRVYTGEYAAREVGYLCQVLKEYAPGNRVIDVSCGLGWRAIALAEAGFEVTALEVSEWAIKEARSRADRAGVQVRWEFLDPSALSPWSLDMADAAIYLPWVALNWGASQRLLRRVRYHLTSNGVLVAGRSPFIQSLFLPSPFLSSPLPSASIESERAPDHSLRLPSEYDITLLVKSAGFAVQRVDAELTPGSSVAQSSGRVHVIGRSLQTPPFSLAVTSWRNPTGVLLDMRYAPDEAELLDPPPGEIWNDFILSASRNGADLVGNYAVDDPFGSERGADAVSQYFDCRIKPHQLTFAAGVTSLLHDLCGLADGGLILAPELTHGDLEAWALVRGTESRLLDEPVIWDHVISELESARPALLHFDRPSFTGQVIGLNELKQLLSIASRVGAVVLIDESPAPYLGPLASAARLIDQSDNLVVLRGFTKAYSWGGLRAGFALASEAIARHVRELIPPLQVGELALHAALRLLATGDVFARLRERIHSIKPTVIEMLRTRGYDVLLGHEDLPWVAMSDVGGAASKKLASRGICPLLPAPPPALPGRKAEFLRLTIPLSEQRVALFRELLGA